MDERIEQSLGSLIQALLDTHSETREEALSELKQAYVACKGGRCTTDPEVASVVLPHVAQAFEDSNPEVRLAGIQAIELLAPDAEYLISKLARSLSDPVTSVRIAALEALGEFGVRALGVMSQVAERRKYALTQEERSAIDDTLQNLGTTAQSRRTK